MTTQQPDFAAVMRRLEKLERQNRWMKRAGAVVLLLAGAAVLMGGQDQPKGKSAEPEKYVLRDDKGNERAWLGMAKDGPALRFRDEKGKDRVWLGLLKDTPGLVFSDDNGKRRAAMSTGKGTVSLVFYDDSEKARAWLVISKEAAALHLLGDRGQQHAGLSVEGDGVALWHHDKVGNSHVGQDGLKNVPGVLFEGDRSDPLFFKR